jgi:hypothetical protein
MSKSNIIQFPTKLRQQQIARDQLFESEEYLEELNIHEDCISLARFCLTLIDEAAIEHYDSAFDMNVLKSDEYKDMFVILNLLVSVFMRSQDQKHILQDDLTELYAKLKILEYHADDGEEIDFDNLIIKDETEEDDIT